jgi:hypothetical protein
MGANAVGDRVVSEVTPWRTAGRQAASTTGVPAAA